MRGSFCCAMPSLTDAEKVALQRAVSVHGRDWGAIAATGALGARNALAIRWAWDALSSRGVTAAKIVVADPELAPLVAGPESAVARLPEALGRQAARRIHSQDERGSGYGGRGGGGEGPVPGGSRTGGGCEGGGAGGVG